MKPKPRVLVFDVGHGNCVFIEDGDATTVVDCKDSMILINYLISRKIEKITQVIISHSDSDHIDGILALIQTDYVKIGTVYVNPDVKDSDGWNFLKLALDDAHARKELDVRTEVGSGMERFLEINDVKLEVLAPGVASRLSGPNGKTKNGKPATSNTMSVVIRILHKNHSVMMIPGDLDKVGFEELIGQNRKLEADIILFPHHGGNVKHGRNQKENNISFVKTVIDNVKPKLFLFSIGRGQFSNPRPEIVSAIKKHAASSHIHCTQLSKNCHMPIVLQQPGHLADLPAVGRDENICCGGTMEIILNGKNTIKGLDYTNHKHFINKIVNNPICKHQ